MRENSTNKLVLAQKNERTDSRSSPHIILKYK
jgi:hypothetical protein